jgi:hypothetical protein
MTCIPCKTIPDATAGNRPTIQKQGWRCSCYQPVTGVGIAHTTSSQGQLLSPKPTWGTTQNCAKIHATCGQQQPCQRLKPTCFPKTSTTDTSISPLHSVLKTSRHSKPHQREPRNLGTQGNPNRVSVQHNHRCSSTQEVSVSNITRHQGVGEVSSWAYLDPPHHCLPGGSSPTALAL